MEKWIMKLKRTIRSMKVKTTILGLAVTAAFIAPAQAAFLAPGSSGSITVTGGCFTFGICAIGGLGNITDVYNNTTAGIGSGVTGNGRIGQMNFTVDADGNTIHLTSFEMDTYQNTAGGDINTRMVNTAAAGGYIDDAGNMALTLNGRTSFWQFDPVVQGEQPWNLQIYNATTAPACAPGTGAYTPFTTGTSSNMDCNTGATNTTLTGSALVGGGGTWTGTIVSAGNVGNRGFFDGTPYTEIFNITVTGTAAVVPVPAAVWLFGSGLLGLLGLARRKKAMA
jgi:hypothetical protein